jgi:hypothetical protein
MTSDGGATPVLLDEGFAGWLDAQQPAVRMAILGTAKLLAMHGAALERPYAAEIEESGYGAMRELRLEIEGAPWRVLFAIDPAGAAILLLGGQKNDVRWYRRAVPDAAALYERHLTRLRRKRRA